MIETYKIPITRRTYDAFVDMGILKYGSWSDPFAVGQRVSLFLKALTKLPQDKQLAFHQKANLSSYPFKEIVADVVDIMNAMEAQKETLNSKPGK